MSATRLDIDYETGEVKGEKELHQLYRHWDAEERLLYVGISLSAVGRLSQHRKTALWYERIAKVTIENFNSREELEAAEKEAIKREKPLHNIKHAAKIRIQQGGDEFDYSDEFKLDIYNLHEDEFQIEMSDAFHISVEQRKKLGIATETDNKDLPPEDQELLSLMDMYTTPEMRDVRVLGLILCNSETGDGAVVAIGEMSHSTPGMSDIFVDDVLTDCVDDIVELQGKSSRQWRQAARIARRSA